ncbi:protein WVD2-like 4 [Aristolochia californica]|uniref:protein WVD2-like 4 n=1 Tax=Aristolochia californica TaxID=171875 RepID=UPI0035D5469D
MDMPNLTVSESGNFAGGEDTIKGITPSPGKENESFDNVADAVESNGVSDDSSSIEGKKSSNGEVVSPVRGSVSRNSNLSKKPGAERSDRLNKSKMPKDETDRKVLPTMTRKQGRGPSQSLSLPSKGILTNGLRKSIDTIHHSQANVSEPVSSVSNGSLNSTSRMDNPRRRALTGATSIDTLKALAPPKLSTSISGSTSRQSQAKHGSLGVATNNVASDALQNGTSGVLRKFSGSGFAFRSDERAQKRKEFYLKIDEKIQAKEAEKNNLQAKTKEDQQVEIKQLRKSLAFKATPMPTFYHEPPPPRGEIKKIPTTRPKSPKLGRHKPSMSLMENGTERVSGPSRHSLQKMGSGKQSGTSLNGNGDVTTVKISTRRSHSKLPSSKQSSMKQDEKPTQQKPKMTDQNSEFKKLGEGETLEKQEAREDSPPVAEISTYLDLDSFQNSVDYDEAILNLPDPPDEMSVK